MKLICECGEEVIFHKEYYKDHRDEVICKCGIIYMPGYANVVDVPVMLKGNDNWHTFEGMIIEDMNEEQIERFLTEEFARVVKDIMDTKTKLSDNFWETIRNTMEILEDR